MLDRNDRIGWNALRYQYYSAGRLAFFYGLYNVGLINLGYAIESYLNQGLKECGEIIKDNDKHDLKKKMKQCHKAGIFNEIEFSHDFMLYANSSFKMRYPKSLVDEHLKYYDQGRAIHIESTYIHFYDDFIVQLDNSLLKYTNEFVCSILVRAAADITSNGSKMIYYYNPYAFKNFEETKKIVIQNYPTNNHSIEILNEGEDLIFNSFNFRDRNYLKVKETSQYLASNFKIIGKVKKDKHGNLISISTH